MIIKVCGLRDKVNIKDICSLDIHMIGLNFYKPSSRYVPSYNHDSIDQIPDHIDKVGVFVKEELSSLKEKVKLFGLDYIQLHGDESPEYCQAASEIARVIKVFRVDEDFEFSEVSAFYESIKYYLFDTKTKHFGGSGKQFSWNKLDEYHGTIPFLLSGGIGPKDHQAINEINHKAFAGIDINSQFEVAPAIKSKSQIETFIQKLKQINSEISS